MATEHYCSRMIYFENVVGLDYLVKAFNVLVSGYAAGSEMIVARQYGMGKIFGVEIEPMPDERWLFEVLTTANILP